MSGQGGITSGQIKAARALLDWSQEDLASVSRLSITTIRNLELGCISPRHSTTQLIRRAFEEAGLEFIESEGIRRCHEDIKIYQGVNGIAEFLEDIRQTASVQPGDIVIVADSETVLFSSENREKQCREFEYIVGKNSTATIKCLLTDGREVPISTPHFEFRSISKNYVDPIPFYVYGNRHAMIVPGAGLSHKIISIHSVVAAQAARRQFYSMWEMATPAYMQSREVRRKERVVVYQ